MKYFRMVSAALMCSAVVFSEITMASVFTETFSHGSNSSWGSNWNPLARGDRLSVSDGYGLITHNDAGATEVELKRYGDLTHAEMSVQIKFKQVPEVGYVDGSLILRQYHFRLRYSDTSLRLVIEHRSDGTVDQLVNMPLDLDRASRSYSLRAVVAGSSSVRIAAQVWQEGQIPPAGWVVDMADESLLTKVESGAAGIKSLYGSQSQGGAIVAFDNYSVSKCADSLCGLTPKKTITTTLFQNDCIWKTWGSKGEIGAAVCPIGQYVAGHEGLGITTGGKRNFGKILCCSP